MIKPQLIPARSPLVRKYFIISSLVRKQLAIQSYKSDIGIIWVVIDPIIRSLILALLIRDFLKARTVPEIPILFFVLLGMQQLRIFKDGLNSGMNAIGTGREYMAYHTIGTFDVFVSKIIYNFLANIFGTVLIITASIWWGINISLSDLDNFILMYVISLTLGCSCGLSIGNIASKSVVIKKMVTVFSGPLLFLSCILHPYAWVSPYLAQYLYWNPLVHCVELGRKSLFPHYYTEDLNIAYPCLVAIIMAGIGINVYYKNRNKI